MRLMKILQARIYRHRAHDENASTFVLDLDRAVWRRE
jgi:hypothetical protein